MSNLMDSEKEKRKFIYLQIFFILFSIFILATFQPEEKGFWIFKRTVYHDEFFAGIAFLIASTYLIFITKWYNNNDMSFNWKISLKTFLLSGFLSIILSTSLLYPIWEILGFEKIETSWWIFKKEQYVPENEFVAFMSRTSAIAGPVEELAKLLSVIIIPSIRNSIVDKKTGIYYAILCAFGFAMIENISYFVNYKSVLFLRANPAHAVFSSIWGYGLGKYFNKEISIITFMSYLILGMAVHSIWNISASIAVLFIVVFILTSYKGLKFIKHNIS